MGRIPWEIGEPGHFEVDLVHHSGESSAGLYWHTIQLVDVATGWSERVAVLGRGQTAMEAGFRRILRRLPFPIRELHRDLGSEFFNAHLVRFWKEKVTGAQLSRSRPFQKNDNRMVEQKNDTLVRQYVGHLRLDTPSHVAALDALYEQMWLYYNLFQPVLHLCEKTIVDDKVHRKWDQAKTPYERLLDSGILSPEWQARVPQLYEQTNPLQLREAIYRQLATLWEAATTEPSSAA
jgi:transposase InsO family protein